MINNVLIYVVLAFIIAVIFAAYSYLFKSDRKKSINIFLFSIRFLAVFLILLLLINPKIKNLELEIIKPTLVIVTDNSASISNFKQEAKVSNIVEIIENDKQLNAKFSIDYYTFSDNISATNSLTFDKKQTNIYKALRNIDKIYLKNIAPNILISDGNQTLGKEYSSLNVKQPIYPIIIGDTTQYRDIRISQLNVNKYAYLKNKFPVEIFVTYQGNTAIQSKLTVMEGNTIIYSENIALDDINNSKRISFLITANTVGLHSYKIALSPLKKEVNTWNNNKNISVEIIDEQSEIVIISDILHPDIAMFKRSIESNKQRKVTILKPNRIKSLSKYQLVILYQPTSNFKEIFEKLNKEKNNFIIITGTQTNWNFLNNVQPYFNKKAIQNTEDYIANYNAGYTTYLINNLGFDNFPPITDFFGKVTFKVPFQSILHQQVGSFPSEEPLLATFTDVDRRGAILLGENSWRWRMTSKLEENSFQPFDTFINGLVQYLSSDKKARFLEVTNAPVFYENETVVINAKYYDANYVFNPKIKLWTTITNKSTKKSIKYPFALKNNNYEVQISDIKKGNYSFSVYDALHKSTNYGNFTMLDYNMEQQFSNANKSDLEKLSLHTNGKVYYPNSLKKLINELINNDNYKAIQKSKEILKSLIDWQWILGIIVLLLSVEWFIRKYKGYI